VGSKSVSLIWVFIRQVTDDASFAQAMIDLITDDSKWFTNEIPGFVLKSQCFSKIWVGIIKAQMGAPEIGA
jgi:hypothetical protein